jgi:hypothetical protein
MKITIEVEELAEAEQLMEWLHHKNFIRPEDNSVSISVSGYKPTITKGDKSIDPKALEGIWKDNPRTLEEIRKGAWGDRL